MKFIFTIILGCLATFTIKAQDNITTTTFDVSGNCNMCKKRIDNAALVKGVKFAEWDKDAKKMKVVFRNDKTNLETIQASILKAGYDVGEQKANEDAYNALPNCCHYKHFQCND